ncbi:MAG TPA: PIN domain-containing protein [Tepidisphaeraceae bacterium]|nr:PIN domain-containing protein [Tepidisphaeraceae bacterium]
MRILFDTSAIVPALITTLPRHSVLRSWLDRPLSKEFEFVVAAHVLAETYSVLTRLPLSPRISPSVALRLIKLNIIDHAEVIALPADGYHDAITRAASAGVHGGAQSAKVDHLITCNPTHFHRVWPDAGQVILAIE